VQIADFGFAEYVGSEGGFILGPTSGTDGYKAPECHTHAAMVRQYGLHYHPVV
jgi:serine/threonine protein kinase